ncbi:MAG TPA: hypothetical protein DEO84_05735 [candidate division Zixibacteria bacterium]|jgi:hypothetical protein|nr:hypothetical protein [candidate division Zixibacteria bacterium]HBZ00807.1 hypothetical protein [candidate division Zixibacteria bacterium]
MKSRFLMAFMMVAILAPLATAKKEKTITYKDSTLTDAKYGYTMTVSNNWKVRAQTEPSTERAYLEKKNYSVNRMIQTYGGDYTIPTVMLFATDFNGTVEDFEALLVKSLEEHRTDNEIISKLGLLQDSELITSIESRVDSITARQIILKRNYKRLLANDAYGSQSVTQQVEKVINDHEVHEIFAFKKGNTLFVFHAFSEREFYGKENKAEFEAMAASIAFRSQQ